MAEAATVGDLLINPIIYSEVSIALASIEETDSTLEIFEMTPLPKPALFLAGKVFLDHRRRGGLGTTPLPDYFIGAHAAVLGVPLITRDAKRYRTCFPPLRLITS